MMTPEEQAYVRKLEETIVKLEVRIAELERRLNMNSSNSSKPPSTDKPNQKKRSLRKPSGKKPGGQSGHKGTTLKLPCAPSKIIPCNPKECAGCALAGQCQGKCLESRYFMSVLKLPYILRLSYMLMKQVCVHRGKQYGYIMFLLRGTPTSMSAKNAGKMACGREIFSNITKA